MFVVVTDEVSSATFAPLPLIAATVECESLYVAAMSASARIGDERTSGSALFSGSGAGAGTIR